MLRFMVSRWFRRGSPDPPVPPTDEELTQGGDDLGTGVVPNTRRSTVRYAGGERLMEGVYYEIDRRIAHYVLDDTSEPLCGPLPGAKLYRRLDAWYVTPELERCPVCAGGVGERGQRRHGWATVPGAADRALWTRSRAEWERQWLLRDLRSARHVAVPPFDEDGSFEDPPFILHEDPQVNRLRGDENRVRNDVYAKPPKGKKWHRVYAVSVPPRGLETYGRGYTYPCGYAGSEFEPLDGWYYEPLTVQVGVPPSDDICKACARSDAKYGKRRIEDRARWDR